MLPRHVSQAKHSHRLMHSRVNWTMRAESISYAGAAAAAAAGPVAAAAAAAVQ
jgi:hypothetical protein